MRAPLLPIALFVFLAACGIQDESADSNAPALPILPLTEFSLEIQQAAPTLEQMSLDGGIAAVAPLIPPFIFSWSVSATSPAEPLGFAQEEAYAYALRGTPDDTTGTNSGTFLELAVGPLSPQEIPAGPEFFDRIGYQLEPILAPINLEPDGSAPVYRKDTTSGMTLAFRDDRYFVAVTVTDSCDPTDVDARMMGSESCFSWDELQMFLDTLAVIDPNTLQ